MIHEVISMPEKYIHIIMLSYLLPQDFVNQKKQTGKTSLNKSPDGSVLTEAT